MLEKNSNGRPPKRAFKILFLILLIVILLALASVISLPFILSTHWGKEKLVQSINSRIAGHLFIDELNLNWFDEQTLKKTQLFDSAGQEILSFDALYAKTPLWKLLFNGGKIGVYELINLDAKVIQEADGQINISQALMAKNSSSHSLNENQNLLSILLKDVNASVSLEPSQNHFEASGKTFQNGIEGTFNLTAALDHLSKDQIFKDKNHLNIDQLSQIKLQADVRHFPVSLLDEILAVSKPKYKGLLLAAFGDWLDLNIHESRANEGLSVDIKIASPLANGTLQGLLKDDRLVINKSNAIEMTLQPILIEKLNQALLNEQKIKLIKATKGYFNVPKLELVFDLENDKNAFIDLTHSSLIANLSIDTAELQSSALGDLSLKNFKVTFDTSDNQQANFQAKILPSIDNNELNRVLGGDTDLEMRIDLADTHKSPLNLELKSEKIQAKVKGYLENFEKLFLAAPAQILLNLTPDAINALGLKSLKLENNSQIQIQIFPDPKGIYLKLARLNLKGSLTVDQINLYGNAGSLRQLSVPWEVHVPENYMSFQAKGLTRLNSGMVEGSLDGFFKITRWFNDEQIDFSHASLVGQVKLVNFPVGFIEKITSQEDLISLIGQAVNLEADANFSDLDKLNGALQVSIKGKDLSGQGAFSVKDGVVVSKAGSPFTFKLNLMPDQFQVLRKRFLNQEKHYPEMILSAPSQILFTINSLAFPLRTSETPLWLKANIIANLAIDGLSIQDKSNGEQVWFQDIQGTLESPELAKNISFSISGRHNQLHKTPLPFSINGRAENSFTPTGELNSDNLTLFLNTKFEKFPVKILGQFLGTSPEISQRISAVLGDTINADVHVHIDHLQGPVTANIGGDNGQISLDAKINKGILTLNKNFRTQIALTKEFGKAILEDIFPLAGGLIGSDNPLTINIDAAGFALPIKNFNIKSVQIGSASLELGKVRFRSEGQLGTILSLFNTSGTDQISVWFTPLYVKMQEGVINFQRMDMLIMDAYPIATWGLVDLASDKVNMIIGLTAQALKKGFNIPDLGKDYILQIPFKGTISSASIDKKKAIAKIAALVASNRGPEGLLIGTALHIASGGLTEEKAPPPTTNPLPWSTGSDTPEKPRSDTKHPLHEVEDKATSILRNVLPF